MLTVTNLTGFGGAFLEDINVAGQQFGWGLNDVFQLGLIIDNLSRSSPTAIGSLFNWEQATAGAGFSLAVKTDGTLWGWGSNSQGALGLPDTTPTPVESPIQVGELNSWVEVSGGTDLFTLAHRQDLSDDIMFAWGKNNNGQLGQNDTVRTTSPVQVPGIISPVALSAGNNFSFVVQSDGTMKSFGSDANGQLGIDITVGTNVLIPTTVAGTEIWADVACGSNWTMAITTGNILFATGFNNAGQLGLGNNTPVSSFVQVGSETWNDVDCGEAHTLAVRSDNTLWAWGSNEHGAFGIGTDTGTENSPILVDGDSVWAFVSAGESFSIGIRTNGDMYAWGHNEDGQLGLDTDTDVLSPVQVGALQWKKLIIAPGSDHCIGILA